MYRQSLTHKQFLANGAYPTRGTGLFAREFTKRFPLMPVAEEGMLQDESARADFIERVFSYRR